MLEIEGDVYKMPEHIAWANMIQQCKSTNRPDSKYYSLKGIRVCGSWSASFINFYNDLGPKPSSIHVLDRIDKDKDFNKDNCRWVLKAKQRCSKPRYYQYLGKMYTITELHNLLSVSIPLSIFRQRVNKGMEIELAMSIPVKVKKRLKT
jgi:hypothetical protein